MTLQYMGTLKATERNPALLPFVEPVPCADESVKAPRHLDVHLPVREMEIGENVVILLRFCTDFIAIL